MCFDIDNCCCEGKTTSSSDLINRLRSIPSVRWSMTAEGEFQQVVPKPPVGDLINHPPHYTQGGIDTFDFIKAKGLTYAEGNVIKYIVRARHKGNLLDDLRKAEWYLKQLIAEAENEPQKT